MVSKLVIPFLSTKVIHWLGVCLLVIYVAVSSVVLLRNTNGVDATGRGGVDFPGDFPGAHAGSAADSATAVDRASPHGGGTAVGVGAKPLPPLPAARNFRRRPAPGGPRTNDSIKDDGVKIAAVADPEEADQGPVDDGGPRGRDDRKEPMREGDDYNDGAEEGDDDGGNDDAASGDDGNDASGDDGDDESGDSYTDDYWHGHLPGDYWYKGTHGSDPGDDWYEIPAK